MSLCDSRARSEIISYNRLRKKIFSQVRKSRYSSYNKFRGTHVVESANGGRINLERIGINQSALGSVAQVDRTGVKRILLT